MIGFNFNHTAPLIQDAEGTVRITGSRVTLDTIAWAFRQGKTPEGILDSFPSLTLSQIYGVIAWYLEHQNEADAYLAKREAEADTIQKQIESQPGHGKLREKLRRCREEVMKN